MKKIAFALIFISLISCSKKEVPTEKFIEISKLNPDIVLDLRYATENNFLKEQVYPEARCFLVESAAIRLDSVQKELEEQGLGLKVFDGYRPLGVQKKMWEILPDNRYVADPASGSRHNRGAAVDVTLVDSSGLELPMPTGFDDFTEKASHKYESLPDEIKQNRNLLKTTMEKYGFQSLDSEWWHYDLKDFAKYPVLDYSFEEIDRFNQKLE